MVHLLVDDEPFNPEKHQLKPARYRRNTPYLYRRQSGYSLS